MGANIGYGLEAANTWHPLSIMIATTTPHSPAPILAYLLQALTLACLGGLRPYVLHAKRPSQVSKFESQ